MKSANMLALVVSLAITATFVSGREASAATTTNHSGTICKNYNAGDATEIDYLPSGARSLATYATPVICPLVRSTTRTAGATAYVDVQHNVNISTNCTVYSYDKKGVYLGSTGANWTGTGFHEFALTLGAGKSTSTSDYAVLCTIPGNGAGTVMGVDLKEF